MEMHTTFLDTVIDHTFHPILLSKTGWEEDTLSLRFLTDNNDSHFLLSHAYGSGTRPMVWEGQQMHFYFARMNTGNQREHYFRMAGGKDARLWYIKDLHHVHGVPLTKQNGDAVFYWEGELYGSRLICFDDNSLMHPVFDGLVDNQNILASPPANYLVVCLPKLKQQAQELADYRQQKDGFSTLVVPVDKIYHEFSSGKYDPAAIRNFTRLIYDKGRGTPDSLQYLVLFGDGRLDCYPCDPDAVLPVFYSLIRGDDFFGVLHDELILFSLISSANTDVALGRLPANTPEEAEILVKKIKQYDQAMPEWNNQITLMADRYDHYYQYAFRGNPENIARFLADSAQSLSVTPLFLDDYESNATAHDSLLALLYRGQAIISYFGHSTSRGWANDLLSIEDIRALKNNVLPIVFSFSCSFANFDLGEVSVAEELLLSPEGGAIAVLGNPRPSSEHDTLFANHVFRSIAAGKKRIGNIFRAYRNRYDRVQRHSIPPC